MYIREKETAYPLALARIIILARIMEGYPSISKSVGCRGYSGVSVYVCVYLREDYSFHDWAHVCVHVCVCLCVCVGVWVCARRNMLTFSHESVFSCPNAF